MKAGLVQMVFALRALHRCGAAPTLDGLGGVGDGAHASHEFVFSRALPERAALLALLLMSPVAAAGA